MYSINHLKTVRKIFNIFFFVSITTSVFAQSRQIKPNMSPDHWEYNSTNTEFVEHNGVISLHIKSLGKPALYKDQKFLNGTIEYDIDPQDDLLNGIYFRAADVENAEYFYLRPDKASIPNSIEAIQYAPTIKGLTYWTLLPHYQSAANFKRNTWNHIKLVVSGDQMLVYVNDMNKPSLVIPKLEGNFGAGFIAFNGTGYISNIIIKPNITEGLSPVAGLDLTLNDPRFLRNWKYTDPVNLQKGREPISSEIPKEDVSWKSITAENCGLINFSRLYNRSQNRRMIWLKVTLLSPVDQIRFLNVGFSDEIWGFVNDEIAFSDKNIYFEPVKKDPEGRVSIQNGKYRLPLKTGENKLVIALANNYFGWGLIARLDSMEGIQIVEQEKP